MEQRARAAAPRKRLLFWLIVNLLVLVCLGASAARWGRPRHAGPPAYMLEIGAAARALSPQVGAEAPDFRLPTLDGSRQVSLSDHRGERPVVLIFGSYTCPIFRGHFDAVNEAYARYQDEAQFLFIYIREAHPEEDGAIPENASLGPIREHQSLDERSGAAQTCAMALDAQMPILVDTMDNGAATSYHAWPERMYVVDERGMVAYSGSGPGDFNAAAMSAALLSVLDGSELTAEKK